MTSENIQRYYTLKCLIEDLPYYPTFLFFSQNSDRPSFSYLSRGRGKLDEYKYRVIFVLASRVIWKQIWIINCFIIWQDDLEVSPFWLVLSWLGFCHTDRPHGGHKPCIFLFPKAGKYYHVFFKEDLRVLLFHASYTLFTDSRRSKYSLKNRCSEETILKAIMMKTGW